MKNNDFRRDICLRSDGSYRLRSEPEQAEGCRFPEIALKNVEALADNEIGNGRWIVTVYSPSHWKCDPNGGASCPGTPW